MSLFTRAKKEKRTLIFHIGSSQVIAVLVTFQKKGSGFMPKIEHSVEVSMPILGEVSSAALEALVIAALLEAARTMVSEGIGAPDEIVCFLASPWYASEIRKIRLAKNIQFKVTRKLVDDLVKKEADLFRKEELAGYGEEGDEALIIEQEIKQLLVNGYQVAHPEGQMTKEIEISLLLSMSPRRVLQKMTDSIAASFHTTTVRFHTFMHGGTDVLGDVLLSHDQFMLADVGGELTDVAIVSANGLTRLLSFPVGVNTFLRTFAKEMKKSVPDSRALLSLYNDEKLERSTALRVGKALDKSLAPWTNAFEGTLEKGTENFLIPHAAALVTESDMYSHFKKAISNESFAQHSLTEKPFTIVSVKGALFDTFVHAKEKSHLRPHTSIEALTLARKEL